jgi:hypothetical protein
VVPQKKRGPGRPKGDPRKNKITQAARLAPISKERVERLAKRVSSPGHKVVSSDVMREGVETFVDAERLVRQATKIRRVGLGDLRALILRAIRQVLNRESTAKHRST